MTDPASAPTFILHTVRAVMAGDWPLARLLAKQAWLARLGEMVDGMQTQSLGGPLL